MFGYQYALSCLQFNPLLKRQISDHGLQIISGKDPEKSANNHLSIKAMTRYPAPIIRQENTVHQLDLSDREGFLEKLKEINPVELNHGFLEQDQQILISACGCIMPIIPHGIEVVPTIRTQYEKVLTMVVTPDGKVTNLENSFKIFPTEGVENILIIQLPLIDKSVRDTKQPIHIDIISYITCNINNIKVELNKKNIELLCQAVKNPISCFIEKPNKIDLAKKIEEDFEPPVKRGGCILQ